MIYAVVEVGGTQTIIEPGKFYDVNYMNVNPGDIITINRVLFLSNSSKFNVGYPYLNNVVVRAKVLRHVNANKLTVFKMKPKKNSRIKKGHRQKLTRILIEDLVV